MEPYKLNTLFTGKFLIKLNEIDSTNYFLRNWISNNAPIEGAVILAEHQTAGRGQMGTSWQSQLGQNITLSLLYQPKFLKAQEQFVLSACVAYAIYETVQYFLPQHLVEVKWPNDIMVNRKKICGILIENSIQGSTLHNSIIGIGLNVHQDIFEDLDTATSLKNEGFIGEKEEVLKYLLEKIEALYLQLKIQKYQDIIDQYHQVLLGRGVLMKFKDANGEFFGIIEGIQLDGRIEISTSDGSRFYYHKEVVFCL